MDLQEILNKIGNPEEKRGLRRLVKDGEISPRDAIQAIQEMNTGAANPRFLEWCKRRVKRGL